MKATFMCEKCGYLLAEGTPEDFNWRANDIPCPNCAQLTYGPLTEEMVAEALIAVADKWNEEEGPVFAGFDRAQEKLSVREARFVLRLLNELRSNGGVAIVGADNSARDWLLDLARDVK